MQAYFEKDINKQAKMKNKPVLFFITKYHASFCEGCGRYDIPNYSKKLCRSCYANWMRQRRKWRGRSKLQNSKSHYKKKAWTAYGNNPHCNQCGKREFLSNWELSEAASSQRPKLGLLVHHINGNHADSHISNLEILCKSCHGKSHGQRKKQKKLST